MGPCLSFSGCFLRAIPNTHGRRELEGAAKGHRVQLLQSRQEYESKDICKAAVKQHSPPLKVMGYVIVLL